MIVAHTNHKTPRDPWFDGGAVDSWPIFALGIHRLTAGASAAIVTGWQYTRHKEDKGPTKEMVLEDQNIEKNEDGELLSSYLRGGSTLQRADDALSRKTQLAYDRIVSSPQAREATRIWEVRSIQIHALYLHAMWLHSLSGAEDIVIPYLSYFSELREMQEYSFSTFLEVAKREASRLPLAPLA